MTNNLFDLCVDLLVFLATLFGLSYEAVNIWIFCVAWPVVSLAALLYILYLRRELKHARRCGAYLQELSQRDARQIQALMRHDD